MAVLFVGGIIGAVTGSWVKVVATSMAVPVPILQPILQAHSTGLAGKAVAALLPACAGFLGGLLSRLVKLRPRKGIEDPGPPEPEEAAPEEGGFGPLSRAWLSGPLPFFLIPLSLLVFFAGRIFATSGTEIYRTMIMAGQIEEVGMVYSIVAKRESPHHCCAIFKMLRLLFVNVRKR